MHYENSKLPFPSVTVCPNDRVDWNRALELEPTIFPNDTDEASLKTFRKTLSRLSMMSFGDFDDLDFLKNHNARNLSGRIHCSLFSKQTTYNNAFLHFSGPIFNALFENKIKHHYPNVRISITLFKSGSLSA